MSWTGRVARSAAIASLVVALFGACDRKSVEGSSGAGSAAASAPGAADVDQPHVVFTSPSLVIDRLETPVTPPVTVPSQPSPTAMGSDDPSIVSVEERGALVAHRAGTVTIRAFPPSRSELRVAVTVPNALEVQPWSIGLEPRGSTAVVVRGEDGNEVPAGAVRWNISAPDAVAVVDGRVHALGRAGSFELTAEVGSARAVVPVTVSEGAGSLTVTPSKVRMKPGDLVLVKVRGAAGPVLAEWRSSDPRALSSVGQGLFQAMSAGRARACARHDGREACAEVEVKP